MGTLLNTGMLLCLWLYPPSERILSLQGTTAVIVYQFALTVQVADALTWRKIEAGKEPWPWLTFALITFQPIVGGIASVWTWTDEENTGGSEESGKIIIWSIWGVIVACLLIVATCARGRLGINVGIELTDHPTAKLVYTWHDSKLYNLLYSLGVLVVPFVMYSPWVVPSAGFAQVIAGYLGSASFLTMRATPSFWCWTSFPGGVLSAGAAYLDQSSAIQIGLYIGLTALFTVAAVPYRIYRLAVPAETARPFPEVHAPVLD